MLPGGCGRNKAACPGGRCRRALHLGYGDDAVGDANAVTDCIAHDESGEWRRSLFIKLSFPCVIARKRKGPYLTA